MSDSKSSYRQIMKATSIFGGVQVFNIIIQIIRSKVIAVLLGPAGMGVMGLLNSTISLVTSVTNFGLGTSAVRDISEANATGDENRVKETLSVFRTLAWGTGFLGLLLTLSLSPWLSQLTFGNYDYTFAFAVLSFTLLISQLTAGQTALLQGMRQIKWMAKAGMLSSAVGLVSSLPLYYFLGVQGIVPALVVTSIIIFCVQYYFSNKIKIKTRLLPLKSALQKGKPMIKLGFMLSLSGIITVVASYLVRIFISNFGGIAEVGLYNAGFSIVGVYAGMVFTAMSTDYFPRLSGVNNDRKQYNELINQQSETAILLLSPLICSFLIFINWAIILLYSQQFLPITEMVHFSVLGIYFKALSWSMAFLILAKGDSKAFFWNEFAANVYLLILNCLGYYFDGLRGMGISFLVGYFVYFIQIYFFTRIKYGFSYNQDLPKLLLLQFPLGFICYIVYFLLSGWEMYVCGSILILTSAYISFYWLNKKMQVVDLIKNKLKK